MYENTKYLERIVDTSRIRCDEIKSAMDIASVKIKNTTATNVTRNCHSKKLRNWYILHTVLLVIILLLMITIICYRYAKYRSKQKSIHKLTW